MTPSFISSINVSFNAKIFQLMERTNSSHFVFNDGHQVLHRFVKKPKSVTPLEQAPSQTHNLFRKYLFLLLQYDWRSKYIEYYLRPRFRILFVCFCARWWVLVWLSSRRHEISNLFSIFDAHFICISCTIWPNYLRISTCFGPIVAWLFE